MVSLKVSSKKFLSATAKGCVLPENVFKNTIKEANLFQLCQLSVFHDDNNQNEKKMFILLLPSQEKKVFRITNRLKKNPEKKASPVLRKEGSAVLITIVEIVVEA